jgi:enoyl-CoA hydratase/carnithine racemase
MAACSYIIDDAQLVSGSYQTLIVDKRGPADWVTLNRPDAMNTLNAPMIAELGAYFTALEADRGVRVVVLRASGANFCAGLDLKDMAERFSSLDAAGIYAAQRSLSRIIIAMRRCPQPIVSLIQGAACGGGFAFALASDIRYCTPDARMNAAFIQVGLSGCDVGVSFLLPKLIGSSVASELMLTGKFLTAERAQSLGLVSQVLDPQQLEGAAADMVKTLLKSAPLGLALTKQGLNANLTASSLEAAVEIEDRQQALLASAPEFMASIRAFLAKAR